MEELMKAMRHGYLSLLDTIDLYGQDIGDGHFTMATALASGKLSALKKLSLWGSGLEGDRSEALGNALTSGPFPCLTEIDFSENMIGTKSVKALARAIRSGSLKKLESLGLMGVGINADDMVTLAKAFQHGKPGTKVLPNLRFLYFSANPFAEVGFQALSEVLISGGLDSLQQLDVEYVESSCEKLSKERANALVSAFALNNCLTTSVYFEWHRFPDLQRRHDHLRERNQKNKDILAGLLDSPMVPAAFGKVFLCGSPKVGKTTLSHTLQQGFWKAFFTWQRKPHVEECTRGIEVSRTRGMEVSHFLISTWFNQIKNPITLLVWDMAGQQDYHLVHNTFFPDLCLCEGKATTFVIVAIQKVYVRLSNNLSTG